MKFAPTDEQLSLIMSEANVLLVRAFAGAGKTSSLEAYAMRRPRERMLYIAFNKAIQEEAAARFPSNVVCKTSHGMAFPKFGSVYANAGKLVAKLRVSEITEALDLNDYPDDFRYYVGDAVIRSLNRFLASDAEQIDDQLMDGLVTKESKILTSDLVTLTNRLWDRMCDPDDRAVGMVHDGYLKLYQLSKPRWNADIVLFDEAQDANPVTSSLVEMQQARKVIVGDSHQSLYSFRGATDALKKFKADETLYLTKTFRFGQAIADVANLLLHEFKKERRSIQGTSAHAHIGVIPEGYSHAVIARANGTLFDVANEQIKRGRKINFVGGIQGYRIGDVMDAYSLWMKRKDSIQNPYLKTFKDFDAMDEYAEIVDDRELKSVINLVKRNGVRVPSMISSIRNNTIDSAQAERMTRESMKAPVIHLTTAHKSKGLEWDCVRLTDDYVDLLDDYGRPRKIDRTEEEEINVAYVAATRAKKALEPFPQLSELIRLKKAENTASKMPDWARPVSSLPSGASLRSGGAAKSSRRGAEI